jgi:plasmid maintenance system antidote protein VapI
LPPRRIKEIVLGERAVTADTDLRLARYFGVSDQAKGRVALQHSSAT